MARLLRLWVPPLAWMALIFALSSRPLPAEAERVPDWISHPLAYAALCLLFGRALAGGREVSGREALLAVALSTGYGATDEWHQSHVPGRHAEAPDVAKDLAGAAGAALVLRGRACGWLPQQARRP